MSLYDPPAQPRELRPHQVEAIRQIKASLLGGNKRVVCQIPTGGGKTVLAAEIIKGALAKGNRASFTVPFTILIDQTKEEFEKQGVVGIGVMQASHKDTHYGMPVQICSLQTVERRFIPEGSLVLVDEVHRHFDVIDRWMAEHPTATFIGLTATPWAKGMADRWQDLIAPVRMQELIDQNLLSPFRVYAPSHPDLTGVKTQNGDYKIDQVSEVMSDKTLVADVVETWKRLGENRPTLVFAVDRAHASKLQKEFEAGSVPMGYCDAFVDADARKVLFDKLEKREIFGIINIGTLTTGVDADIRCVVLARPTKSEMLFVQMIGRGLRIAPDKRDCIIIDHADNHARMGFVTDIHHEALLSGRDKAHKTKSEKDEPLPKECGKCGVLKEPKVHECPSCGFKPERQSEVETVAGELVEFKRSERQAAEKAKRVEKQSFWSMALWVDRERGKGGRFAKALYRAKFKSWPDGLFGNAMEPSAEFLSYERSRRIAFAKSKSR